jgi:hypothetical protein
MKAEWIHLKPNEIDCKHQGGKKGIHLEFSLSPYDIPDRVRGRYCPERKRFVIEFRYISEEPLTERRLTEHVSVKEGTNSGRLYDVLIDVDALNIGTITAAITEAREAPSISSQPRRNELNSRLLDAAQNRLLPALAGT